MITSTFKWNRDWILELSQATVAYVYYRGYRVNLLTGFPEAYPLERFLAELDAVTIQDRLPRPRVYHFYYELGLVLMGLGHTVGPDAPLAIELEYARKRRKGLPKPRLSRIHLRSIERIQEHLLDGNCYQVNLTYPFDFETSELVDPRDLVDFFFSRPGLSAYAHATFLGDDVILSNSPECLFQYERNRMFTMPIKGTRKTGKHWRREWAAMVGDAKEEGELTMITDLLRNDLNRLESPRAKVLLERAPLRVPGLLHQCSVLAVDLERPLGLRRSLEALFPGGSVTGAPKKRVMEIIQEVERYHRGIYCGSTLLCLGERKAASINIRTAALSISDRLWRYGAGGGITLLSKPVHEYQEMDNKVSSFLTLLQTPGYQAL
jgi:anthranilate/para-aminobenzoate synthase component I